MAASPPKTSYLHFWGTRGSVPVAGPEYAEFGGNTSCLEIRDEDQIVIIDAGTGIRPLGDELMNSSLRTIHLFIGHTHWDHVIGLPFFAPIYSRDFTIHLYADSKGKEMASVLKSLLNPDFFPVRVEEIKAKMHFHALIDAEPATIGPWQISTTHCDHPGGALGFKIKTPHGSFGYVTDNEFLKGNHEHPTKLTSQDPRLKPYRYQIDFFNGCDLLVHEAQYTERVYHERSGWGHSSTNNATVLIRECGIKKWIITHHDPAAHDFALQHKLEEHLNVIEECKMITNIELAYDGFFLNI